MLKFLRVVAVIWMLAGCTALAIAPSISTSPLVVNAPAPSTAPTEFASPTVVNTPTPAIPVHAGVPEFKHIFVILLENRESNEVTGAQTMPYFNGLIQQYASTSEYYGITHPSLPNYLALTGGSTAGITTDCLDCFVAGDNLANQLKAAGRSWKAYLESMPSPCYVGNDGQYVQRHNPFIYYDNVRKDPAQCSNIVPFTQFAADLQANSLPAFNWISPNVCNDMHDCPEMTGDTWLKTWVPQILASPAWQDRGALFILFDEGSTTNGCCQLAAGGKVALLALSPLAKQGYVSTVPTDHYSLLRTIEDAWHLPLLANAGSPNTANLADLFTTSSPDLAAALSRLIATPAPVSPPGDAQAATSGDMGTMPGVQATPGMTPTATTSFEYDWKEGSNFTIAEWWNASSEAGCSYAANPWPRQALALHRAFVLVTRQVLRNEWDINSWIAKNRPATSEARIHGAETGCYSGHIDYPAHIHVFYLARDAKGTWLHLNSHNYMDAQGRFNDDFVIPDICGQKSSYHVAVNQWLSMLDEQCTTVWQQRYTSAGDMELRRSETAPTYALRARSASGDLASADVLLAGKVIATAEILRYDPIAMTMTAVIKDYQKKQQTLESWQGNPQAGKNLTEHTSQTTPMTATAPAPITPGALLGAGNGAGTAPRASTTVTLTVAAGNDNVYQDGTDLTLDVKSIYVGDNRDPNNSYAGLRFDVVPIPTGAPVRKATLQLHAPSDQTTHVKFNVYGAASGETQPFGPDNLPGQMPATTAHLPYEDSAGWAGNAWISLDVTSIVGEITGRGDWKAGNALTIILKGISGQQGFRRAVDSYASWDHSNVPRLVITY